MNRYLAALAGALAVGLSLAPRGAVRGQAIPPAANVLRAAEAAAAPAEPAQPPAAAATEAPAPSPPAPRASGDDEAPRDELAPNPRSSAPSWSLASRRSTAPGCPATIARQSPRCTSRRSSRSTSPTGRSSPRPSSKKQLDELPTATADYSARLANPLPPYDDVSGEVLAEIEKRVRPRGNGPSSTPASSSPR